ncbi:hypothetical protein N0V93_006839 [Gnomoniopsis smithogilvyi]|uniref:U4/U6.U5 small nuclear ribonucleoprotein 27kDa protein domain-containing protein n=1 Tax=Gnomoniopsis smithogilvyi TaxID=1191159 RepID=A0A9W8YQG1_9PEZI|nr:hypothetical protein N0V93_006839 [Gnomoniopsis smithogilvyi]
MADRSSRRGGRPPRDRRGGGGGMGGYRDDRERDRRRYDDDADDRDNRRRYRSRSRDRDAIRPSRDRDRDRDSRRDRSRSRDRPHRDGGAPRDRGDRGDRSGHDARRDRDRGGRGARVMGHPNIETTRAGDRPHRVVARALELQNYPREASMAATDLALSHQCQSRDASYHDDRREGDRSNDDDGAEPMDEDDDVEVEEDGLGDMAAMMGFGGFGSTKGKKVVGNNVGAIRKEKKTEYRQYMNRVGGFNRPLSPGR